MIEILLIYIVLIPYLPDYLFKKIFHCYYSFDPPVLINYNSELVLCQAHLAQHFNELSRIGNEEWLAQKFGKLHLLIFEQAGQDILGMDNAYHIIHIISING